MHPLCAHAPSPETPLPHKPSPPNHPHPLCTPYAPTHPHVLVPPRTLQAPAPTRPLLAHGLRVLIILGCWVQVQVGIRKPAGFHVGAGGCRIRIRIWAWPRIRILTQLRIRLRASNSTTWARAGAHVPISNTPTWARAEAHVHISSTPTLACAGAHVLISDTPTRAREGPHVLITVPGRAPLISIALAAADVVYHALIWIRIQILTWLWIRPRADVVYHALIWIRILPTLIIIWILMWTWIRIQPTLILIWTWILIWIQMWTWIPTLLVMWALLVVCTLIHLVLILAPAPRTSPCAPHTEAATAEYVESWGA